MTLPLPSSSETSSSSRRVALRRSRGLVSLSVLVLLALPLACANEPEFGAGDDGNGSGEGGAGGDGSSTGKSTIGGIGTGEGGSGSTGTIPGGSSTEICDGKDNDGDGQIDNLDVGGDGICDCLNIGTLGLAGVWGQGDVFSDWVTGKSTAGVVDLAEGEITAEALEPYEVIIAQDLRRDGEPYTQSEIDALQAWVEAGGGLMTLIGYGDSTEVVNVNSLLEPFGVSYGTTPILPKGGTYTRAVDDFWHESHPVALGVSAIGVDNGYEVLGGGTVLATEGGFDMLRAVTQVDGRVLVWGDEWITYNSEWTQDADAPVEYQVELFWLNAIKWLSPPEACQVPIPPIFVK